MKSTDRTLRSNRQRYQIYRDQRGMCAICGNPLEDNFEIDHIKPKCIGGVTAYFNLQAVHISCNRRKGGQYES